MLDFPQCLREGLVQLGMNPVNVSVHAAEGPHLGHCGHYVICAASALRGQCMGSVYGQTRTSQTFQEAVEWKVRRQGKQEQKPPVQPSGSTRRLS